MPPTHVTVKTDPGLVNDEMVPGHSSTPNTGPGQPPEEEILPVTSKQESDPVPLKADLGPGPSPSEPGPGPSKSVLRKVVDVITLDDSDQESRPRTAVGGNQEPAPAKSPKKPVIAAAPAASKAVGGSDKVKTSAAGVTTAKIPAVGDKNVIKAGVTSDLKGVKSENRKSEEREKESKEKSRYL